MRPGDTLWLRGGRYVGAFTSVLNGTAAAPIMVRGYPGEHAVLDGPGTDLPMLNIKGAHTWFRGFEITDSDALSGRVTSITGSHPAGMMLGDGVVVNGANTKLINLVIHDTGQGVSFWTPAVDSEVYGCLIYNNGWLAPDRGHGQGLYIQNATGTKYVTDVISFNNYSTGMKAYAQGGQAVGVHFEGIVSFSNGAPAAEGTLYRETNFFVGTTTNPLDRITLQSSAMYHVPGASPDLGANIVLGYTAANKQITVKDNYVAGGTHSVSLKTWATVTMTGNLFHGALRGFTASAYPQNQYYSATTKPPGTKTIVRPNRYELGRANIAIFNWDHLAAVAVDVSAAGLQPGDAYVVRDTQDYLGAPVESGIYTGAPITVRMSNLRIAQPMGHSGPALSHTAPEFGAFVLERIVSGLQAPAAPANVRIVK